MFEFLEFFKNFNFSFKSQKNFIFFPLLKEIRREQKKKEEGEEPQIC